MSFAPPTFNGYLAWLLAQQFPSQSLFQQNAPLLNIDLPQDNLQVANSTPQTLLAVAPAQSGSATDWVTWSYENAINGVYDVIASIDAISYTLAVYNWAADWLINNAVDQYPQTYFSTLQSQYQLNTPVVGVVNSTSDENTSASFSQGEQLRNLSIMSLNQNRTPWGRAYLAIAGATGPLWGLT